MLALPTGSSVPTLSVLTPAAKRLPIPTRVLFASVVVTAVTLVYLASNHFPLRTPTPLPPNIVDRVIGVHAWAIWPYWLLLVIAPIFILATTDRRIFLATLRAYAIAMTANARAWLAWLTRLAREHLPHAAEAATGAAWHLLHQLDSDINCFPSARSDGRTWIVARAPRPS